MNTLTWEEKFQKTRLSPGGNDLLRNPAFYTRRADCFESAVQLTKICQSLCYVFHKSKDILRSTDRIYIKLVSF